MCMCTCVEQRAVLNAYMCKGTSVLRPRPLRCTCIVYTAEKRRGVLHAEGQLGAGKMCRACVRKVFRLVAWLSIFPQTFLLDVFDAVSQEAKTLSLTRAVDTSPPQRHLKLFKPRRGLQPTRAPYSDGPLSPRILLDASR